MTLFLDAGVAINEPKYSFIVGALNDLDGEHQTELTLKTDKYGSLSISGGNDNLVVVVYFDVFERSFTLVDLQKHSDKTIFLVAGGQPSEFPSRQCVSKSVAKLQMRSFFFDRKIIGGIWEAENGDSFTAFELQKLSL